MKIDYVRDKLFNLDIYDISSNLIILCILYIKVIYFIIYMEHILFIVLMLVFLNNHI